MLLQKAKVITTPTAYSDGILHSVKPNVVLGDELVVNGTFDTDSNWTKGTGWTISGGSANCDGTQTSTSTFRTNVGISGIQNKAVLISFQVKNYSAGLLNVTLEGTGKTDFTNINSNGVYSASATSTDTLPKILFNADANFVGSIDNVSVKEKIDADFTFTRNSSATRVGEDGYIQDVQIIGGELVQNGDFEQIGSELVTNGSFGDGSLYWTSSGLVTFADGKASFVDNGTNTYSYIAQTVFTASKTYKIEINISRLDGGQVEVLASGGTIGLFSDEGIKTIYHTASSGDILIKRYSASPNFDFDIDNVSVKEVGQNWNVSNSDSTHYVEFSEQGARFVADTTSPILTLGQGISLTSGNKYRFSIRLRNNGGTGNIKVQATGLEFIPDILDGTYTEDIVPTQNQSSVSFYRNGADVDLYIESFSIKEVTDDTNLPRINYEGFSYENGLPIYGSGKGHLLLEGQSTNLVNYSEDASTYTYTESTNGTSLEISPDGAQNASLFQSNTSSNTHYFTPNVYSFPSGVTFTASLFVKKGTGRYFQLVFGSSAYGTNTYANYDLENGLVTSIGSAAEASIVGYGDGWYRCILTGTTAAAISGFGIFFGVSITSANSVRSESHTQELNYHIWGAQCEQNSYATSYIPTNGSAVTRSAETCNNAGNADLFDSEGVLYAEIAALADDLSQRQISIDAGGDITNRIVIRYNNISNNINAYAFSGSVQGGEFNFVADDITEFNKVAIRYKDNDFSFWANGVQVGTDTSGTAPTGLASLQFRFSTANDFRGKTKIVGVFPYLSNDEMECLTGEGYGSFGAMALANNYTIIQG